MVKLKSMSVAKVAKKLGTPGFYIIDNNPKQRWEISHVPGAICLDAEDFTRADLPADLSSTLVFYCSGPL